MLPIALKRRFCTFKVTGTENQELQVSFRFLKLESKQKTPATRAAPETTERRSPAHTTVPPSPLPLQPPSSIPTSHTEDTVEAQNLPDQSNVPLHNGHTLRVEACEISSYNLLVIDTVKLAL